MPGSAAWGDIHSAAMRTLLDIMRGTCREGGMAVEALDDYGTREIEGTLFGGCFSVLTNLLATPYLPRSLAGYILFFEDINESVWKLLRYLNQWRFSGMLDGVQAIVLGRFEQLDGDQSAQTALSFVVGNAAFFGFDAKLLTANAVHIHVPAGATPKDGPSAGISITTSILSAVLNVAPPQAVALSGEITLHGRVLAVGGLKEKFLAAQRHRIFELILPAQNRPAVQELATDVKRNIKIHYVDDYFAAFRLLFNREQDLNYRPRPTRANAGRTLRQIS